MRIVKAPDGLPVRTMGTAKTVGSGFYPSVRSDASHPWEGATELLLAEHDEVVTSYVRSIAQPFRVEAATSAGIERHVVDWARQRYDGRWEILNVKRDWAGFRRPVAQRQSEMARMAADALGAEYREVVHATFAPTTSASDRTLRRNIHDIQSRRFTSVSTRNIALATELLSRQPTLELRRLVEALATNAAHGRALACALMVRRIVAIELAWPLGPASMVTLVPPVRANLPGLFDLIKTAHLAA